jgi:hypothetical protein
VKLFARLLIAATIAFASPAFAESDLLTRTLTPEDLGRLAAFAKARGDAIAAAREGAGAEERAVLEAMLSGEEQPIRGVDIRGDYRCRVAKLGGFLPLVIYDWFACRISEDDIGHLLEKTSGSQRLSGHFVDDTETSLIFYGAGHYGDEEPRPYGADAERNIVGRLVKVGDGRYRLEMPLPQFESNFDILELEAR